MSEPLRIRNYADFEAAYGSRIKTLWGVVPRRCVLWGARRGDLQIGSPDYRVYHVNLKRWMWVRRTLAAEAGLLYVPRLGGPRPGASFHG